MQRGREFIYFRKSRMHVEAGPRCCAYTQSLVKWHGAVMARPYGDAFFIQNFGDIMGVEAIYRESDKTAPLRTKWAENSQAGHIA